MTTFLREIYEVLGCFSTETRIAMCGDLLRRLRAEGAGIDNLAYYFVDALNENEDFDQANLKFIPEGRINERGTNSATVVMENHGTISVQTPLDTDYSFRYLQREIPHLRAEALADQPARGSIDYVACSMDRMPVLGEIKWGSDNDPFYAFIQLLTYLSEMASANQIQRALNHNLFGDTIQDITSFDLHIFLINFNDRGRKGELVDLTHQLAEEFKYRLQNMDQNSPQCVGNILCLSGQIEDERFVQGPELLWMVPAQFP